MLSADFNLLEMIAARPSGARIRDLFALPRPPYWSGESAERIRLAGYVDRDRDGVYTVTDAGRRLLSEGPPPPSPRDDREADRIVVLRRLKRKRIIDDDW
jgi:hypothetical protein